MTSYPRRPIGIRALNLLTRVLPVPTYYYNNILLRRSTAAIPDDPIGPRYSFGIATPDDIDFIMRHPEALPADVYQRRLSNGDRCYCMKRDREIAACNWVRFSSCCVLCGFANGFQLQPLGAGQAFTYDLYTYEAYRREGIGLAIKIAVMHELARDGFREVCALVAPHNTGSLKIHLRLGYLPVRMVYGYRIGSWSNTFQGQDRHKVWLDRWIDAFKASQEIP